MSKLLNILMILSLAFLAACEKEAGNVKLPDFKQKLVVTSFISPSDTVTYIRVSTNRRIFGDINTVEPTGNLSGWISDGEHEIELTHLGEGFCFRDEDMKIEEGRTYHLVITSDNGLSAEAECTVPFRRDFHTRADTTGKIVLLPYFAGFTYRLDFDFYLTDYPGEKNFFRMYGKEITYNYGYPTNPGLTKIYGNENEFFSDEGKDGTTFHANNLFIDKDLKADSIFAVFYILSTDQPYFDYHTSLGRYSGGDVPFTEMSPVYSNIKGGLGIFAAYIIDSLVMKIK